RDPEKTRQVVALIKIDTVVYFFREWEGARTNCIDAASALRLAGRIPQDPSIVKALLARLSHRK
ncbi:MAG: hypothetical protein M3P99_03355, partial [Pseudomonadota bacterium]|nr:hypothetical protein [Pseudomonadota bacterium]